MGYTYNVANEFYSLDNLYPVRILPIISLTSNPVTPPTGHRHSHQVPCNSLNATSQRWPIDTINGLKYFMGKPLNMRIYREKACAQPGIGVHDEQQWRAELRALTEAIGLTRNDTTGNLITNPDLIQPPHLVSFF